MAHLCFIPHPLTGEEAPHQGGLPEWAKLITFFSPRRNVRNKLANVTESLGLAKRTPMGVLLEAAGVEPDIKIM